jgi:predicted kinase
VRSQTTPVAPILVIAGPPGAGKSTVARLFGAQLQPLACVVESDFWWTTIVNGFIPPSQPLAHDQNRTIVRSYSRAAAALASGGYAVVLEGIIGPWNLDLVVAEATAVNAEVQYVVLRPSLAVALARARGRAGEERVAGHPALIEEEPIRKLWHEFADLGRHESHALDTTDLDPAQTVEAIQALNRAGRLTL